MCGFSSKRIRSGVWLQFEEDQVCGGSRGRLCSSYKSFTEHIRRWDSLRRNARGGVNARSGARMSDHPRLIIVLTQVGLSVIIMSNLTYNPGAADTWLLPGPRVRRAKAHQTASDHTQQAQLAASNRIKPHHI